MGREATSHAWWLSTFPDLAILLTMLAIDLAGDRIRDVLRSARGVTVPIGLQLLWPARRVETEGDLA